MKNCTTVAWTTWSETVPDMEPEQHDEGRRPTVAQPAVWSEVGRTARLLLALALVTVLVVLLFHGLGLL